MHGSTSRVSKYVHGLVFLPFILYFIEQLILLNCSSISSNLLTNTRSKFLDFFSL